MAFAADDDFLRRVDDELRLTPRPAAKLFAKLTGGASSGTPGLGGPGKADRVGRMIEAGAWTDAAIALVDLELPAWKLRRLVHEGGEWLCSLSRQPTLPWELDDVVDGRHERLPLAILRAFIEVRHRTGIGEARTSGVPLLQPVPADTICCENFA